MNFLETLKFALMIIETAALLGALIFSAKGIRERKNKNDRKSLLTQGAIYFAIYVVLNVLRFTVFQ